MIKINMKKGERHNNCVKADECPSTRTKTNTGEPLKTAHTPINKPCEWVDNFILLLMLRRLSNCLIFTRFINS